MITVIIFCFLELVNTKLQIKNKKRIKNCKAGFLLYKLLALSRLKKNKEMSKLLYFQLRYDILQ